MSSWQRKIQDALRQYSSGDETPGQPTGDDAQISDEMQDIISQYSNFTKDENALPPGSQERPNQGPFYTPQALFKYLDGGQLIIEGAGGVPIVNPLVWIVEQYNDALQSITYSVYIDEDISP